ncbi:PREDICTED: uncharacterized protein LOC109189662 [Ipomoea nil]|uniref:uncharacterized protein LOC109189662 n=1 Tax=Ipomoea nil TaxID=35883 RepID=UPI0009011363|nr:PREDICTED: uncharacterized protein LOC109189662 [Ipomoea nil]
MGGKIDRNVNKNGGPPIFRINGQNFHYIGSLLPVDGMKPHFAQLYIYDTNNEMDNRVNFVRQDGKRNDIHVEIVNVIQSVLDEHNVLVKTFRMARDELQKNPLAEVKIKLLGKRSRDTRTYNLPQVSEVAALIVGDIDTNIGEREILVETKSGLLEDIPFSTLKGNTSGGRQRISPREYFSYRIQSRISEVSTLLHARRLFQQFLVDAYTMVESGRTRWRFVDGLDIQICSSHLLATPSGLRCRKNKLFGPVIGVIYTIEFQKRGLPHAHILLFLDKNNRAQSGINLDNIISAEFPDQERDPEYFKVVEEFMVHGPCGKARMTSPCMANGKCTKHFPKKFVNTSTVDEDGYPIYRRRDNGRSVMRNGIQLDNRYVVPHNRHLLLKYRAHINVEWCNQSRSIKYLFKYVNKGHDRVTVEFYKSNIDDESPKVIDEINMFYDCRYISPCEAAWRLFGFDIQLRTPAVERLSFHLPNQQSVVFADDDPVDNILSRPTILQSMFLEWFEANKTYPDAKQLTYAKMPTKFVWKKDVRKWQPRKRGFAIGRVFYVSPGTGEIFYLRCLLNKVKGPTSFLDIKKVDGVQYDSFRDACSARGLVDDDREYVHAIEEASQWATSVNLRRLFVTLLMSNSMAKPEVVWEAAWHYLAEDAQFKIRAQLGITDLILSEDEKKNFALREIEIMLSAIGKSLKDFSLMPILDLEIHDRTTNRLIQEELAYDINVKKEENEKLVHQLTEEQRAIYGNVLQDAENNLGGLFFVYGYGGTGKTFLWRALSSALRSKGDIFLNVASSGIASLLLPGGRTAHSRFSIPIVVNEDSTCNISQSSPLAKLIMQCDGTIGESLHGECEINIPEEFVLTCVKDPISTIVDSIFPMFRRGHSDIQYLKDSAILAPTLDIVDAVNEYMNDYNNAEGRTYLSCDSVCKSDSNVDMLADLHTPEFLNGLRCSGVPNHSLTLKVGSLVMLLRNIAHSLGLCNGTRMIISKLADHVLEAQILCGASAGTKVLIPRISLTPSDPRLPFKFQRKQFPLMLSYAMTINKSQGQTLSNMGLFLKRPVFNHGQLYVAVSRGSNLKGLKILIWDENVK